MVYSSCLIDATTPRLLPYDSSVPVVKKTHRLALSKPFPVSEASSLCLEMAIECFFSLSPIRLDHLKRAVIRARKLHNPEIHRFQSIMLQFKQKKQHYGNFIKVCSAELLTCDLLKKAILTKKTLAITFSPQDKKHLNLPFSSKKKDQKKPKVPMHISKETYVCAVVVCRNSYTMLYIKGRDAFVLEIFPSERSTFIVVLDLIYFFPPKKAVEHVVMNALKRVKAKDEYIQLFFIEKKERHDHPKKIKISSPTLNRKKRKKEQHNKKEKHSYQPIALSPQERGSKIPDHKLNTNKNHHSISSSIEKKKNEILWNQMLLPEGKVDIWEEPQKQRRFLQEQVLGFLLEEELEISEKHLFLLCQGALHDPHNDHKLFLPKLFVWNWSEDTISIDDCLEEIVDSRQSAGLVLSLSKRLSCVLAYRTKTKTFFVYHPLSPSQRNFKPNTLLCFKKRKSCFVYLADLAIDQIEKETLYILDKQKTLPKLRLSAKRSFNRAQIAEAPIQTENTNNKELLDIKELLPFLLSPKIQLFSYHLKVVLDYLISQRIAFQGKHIVDTLTQCRFAYKNFQSFDSGYQMYTEGTVSLFYLLMYTESPKVAVGVLAKDKKGAFMIVFYRPPSVPSDNKKEEQKALYGICHSQPVEGFLPFTIFSFTDSYKASTFLNNLIDPKHKLFGYYMLTSKSDR